MSKITLLLGKVMPENWNRQLRLFRDTQLRKTKKVTLSREIYDKNQHFHKISLCTNCMNRLYQLKKTYVRNILDNIDYPNIEFVLINYNSTDGMDDWVRETLGGYINQGVVSYYHTKEPTNYHLCKAKNLSHKMATGDILCNLDGDNYAGRDFAFYLNYLFNKDGMKNLYQFTKPPLWGTVGRIAIHQESFFNLGGYDESFYAVGHDDIDFLDRAKALGIKHHIVEIPNFLKYISNSTTEKVENSGFDKRDYYDLEKINMEKSRKNIENNNLVANQDSWPTPIIYKNFSKQPFAKSS